MANNIVEKIRDSIKEFGNKKSGNSCLGAFERFMAFYALPAIGVIVFVVGMTLLVSYTLKNGLLSPAWRMIIGAFATTMFLAAGQLLYKKNKMWGQLLLAAGIILLYVTAYTFFALYRVLGYEFSFLAFIGITLLALFFALHHKVRWFALLTLIGAFLLPALMIIQGGGGDLMIIASYLLIVAVGFVVLSELTRWHELMLLSFVALFCYYVFYFNWLLPYRYALSYLLVIGGVYLLVPLFFALVTKRESSWIEVVICSVSGLTVFWALYQLVAKPVSLLSGSSHWHAFIYAPANDATFLYIVGGFIAFFVGAYFVLFFQNRSNHGLQNALIYTAALLGMLCIGVTGSYFYRASLFSFIGLALFIWGLYYRTLSMRIVAYIYWSLTAVNLIQGRMMHSLMANYSWIHETAAIAIVMVSLLYASFWGYYYARGFTSWGLHLPNFFFGLSIAMPAYWLFTVGLTFAPHNLIPLLIYSMIVFAIGMLGNHQVARHCSYWLFGLTLAFFGFRYKYDNLIHPQWSSTLNAIFLTLLITWIICLIIVSYSSKVASREKFAVRSVLYFLLAWTLFGWGASLLISNFDQVVDQSSFFMRPFVASTAKNQKLARNTTTDLLLVLYYAISALLMLLFGIFKHERFIRYSGFVVLLLLLYRLMFVLTNITSSLGKMLACLAIGFLLVIGAAFYQWIFRIREEK